MDDKNYIFSQFQLISNKLKKRRILKKPNITEACQQFENLGMTCEADGIPQYAGFCYQAAANCHNTLGNTSEQAHLLLKASRQFMLSYSKLIKDQMVSTDENFHEALVCYEGCLDSYANNQDSNIPNGNVFLAGISMEMADNLRLNLGNIEKAITEYKRTLKLLDKSPLEKISCFQKLVSSKIELGYYDDALKYANDLVEEAEKIPKSGFRDDVLRDSEITRILLLLILQPTPQQISPLAASVLEKYAWVDTVDNSELANLQNIISNKGVSVLNENLFICLQSLVMACQYGDTDCLITLEQELLPYLCPDQKDLIRILVRRKLQKLSD